MIHHYYPFASNTTLIKIWVQVAEGIGWLAGARPPPTSGSGPKAILEPWQSKVSRNDTTNFLGPR